MYSSENLRLPDICSFLGLGRNKVLKLCQEQPYNFPVVKVGNRYQSDLKLLTKWREDLYSGKFNI